MEAIEWLRILVGTTKDSAIDKEPLLKWQKSVFEKALYHGDQTRVVGCWLQR